MYIEIPKALPGMPLHERNSSQKSCHLGIYDTYFTFLVRRRTMSHGDSNCHKEAAQHFAVPGTFYLSSSGSDMIWKVRFGSGSASVMTRQIGSGSETIIKDQASLNKNAMKKTPFSTKTGSILTKNEFYFVRPEKSDLDPFLMTSW